MEFTSKIQQVLDKVGLVNGSHIQIDGRYYGVYEDLTPNDLHIVLDTVEELKTKGADLTDHSKRYTVLELSRHFDNQEKAYRFMFLICLLTNVHETPIFRIAAFGSNDFVHRQGEIRNVVIGGKLAAAKEFPDLAKKVEEILAAKEGSKPEPIKKKETKTKEKETPKKETVVKEEISQKEHKPAKLPEPAKKKATSRKTAPAKSETKTPAKRTSRKPKK